MKKQLPPLALKTPKSPALKTEMVQQGQSERESTVTRLGGVLGRAGTRSFALAFRAADCKI